MTRCGLLRVPADALIHALRLPPDCVVDGLYLDMSHGGQQFVMRVHHPSLDPVCDGAPIPKIDGMWRTGELVPTYEIIFGGFSYAET